MFKNFYKKDGCTTSMVIKSLVIIGGIDLGLIGLGMILGSLGNWNVIDLIVGSSPILEAVVYIVIGVAAVMMIFDCNCSECKGKNTSTSTSTSTSTENVDESH